MLYANLKVLLIISNASQYRCKDANAMQSYECESKRKEQHEVTITKNYTNGHIDFHRISAKSKSNEVSLKT